MNYVFLRNEYKYFLTPAQHKEWLEVISPHMYLDQYGQSTIQSLYYDTDSNLLVRRSIEKPEYKEKIRIRSYGLAQENGKIFVELKKKYDDNVFKRRVCMNYSDAKRFISGEVTYNDSQISREITYFRDFYKSLKPSMLLIYDRTAYYCDERPDLRITFDENIRYRDYDLSLAKGLYGNNLSNGRILMEIKTGTAFPMWLARALSERKIFKTSFSKYGTAYGIQLKAELSHTQYAEIAATNV